jgi:hypothetical protein
MASKAGAIRAGRAFVELFGDDSKLVRVLNQASKRVKAFGTGLMTMGGKMMAGGMSIAAPLIAAVKQFTEFGSELIHMSERTGISVEALSELKYAAMVTGTSIGGFEKGINKMSKTLHGADLESKGAKQTLAELGFAFDDLAGLAPDEAFARIAERIAGIQDPTKKTAIAMALFGKSGTMLIPMMNDLAALRREAQRTGQTMSTQEAESAHVLEVAFETLWGAIRGVSIQVGVALSDSLTEFVRSATECVVSVVRWVKENKNVVLTVAKIAAWVIAGGAALVALGAAIYGVGVAFGVMASIAGVIGTVFSAVVGTLGFIGSVLGAILSPIGLIVVGLAGLAAYFVATGDAGSWFGSILSWLGDSFGWLRDTAVKVWNAITSKIASGDLAGAVNIAWLTIKALWASGISWLYGKWVAFKGWFLQIWSDAVFGTAMLMTDAWAGMQRTWVTVVSAMKVVWSQFTTWAGNLWNSMQQGVGNVFISALEKVGVLTSAEAADAKKEMSKTLDQQKKERTDSAAAYQKQITDDAAKQKAAITQNQADANKALDDQQAAEDKARTDSLAKDAAAADEQAKAARDAWKVAVDDANAEAGAMPGGPGKPKPFAGADITGKTKTSVATTFNAFALSGLGTGGNAQEETARATREMARLHKKWDWQGIPSSIKAT